ncbi:AMP-binding protein [Vibrio gallicus]|uniref:AMP-binding protein n=1 Tax=Vibrio gallicus TaxID=190897 RepID=UPI0021C45B54|nr:AMP-binding protein [Vibrio gallicus]
MTQKPPSFRPITHLFHHPRDAKMVVAFDSENDITWQTLQQDVASVVGQLENTNAHRVALTFLCSYQFSVALLACCFSNKHIVLPGNYQSQALNELGSEFDLLLHDNAIDPTTQEVSCAWLDLHSTNRGAIQWPVLDPKQIALTLFTSGSSGQPKAIHKSLYQLSHEVEILEALWGEQLTDTRIYSTVSHQHIYGLLYRILWPLCAARPFSTTNLEYPEQLVHIASNKSTLISSPALLKRLTAEHQQGKIRCVFSSGGPLSNNAANHAKLLLGHYPIEVFGSTETGGIAHRQQVTTSQPWQLFPNVSAKLNDEGCLRLMAEHISPSSWYQTADQCRLFDDTHFELLGRTDRVVKIEEKRVSLVEVEKRLDQLEWVEESAVISMQDGNRLSLFATLVLTAQGDEQFTTLGKGKFWLAIRAKLRLWLEPVAIPRKIRTVKEIPLNSQGKRQVAEIEKLFANEQQGKA